MDRRLTAESPETPHGYTIEIGNTSYNTTLEERIQAAKIASSISKQRQKQNSAGKISLINSRNTPIGKSSISQNMTVKKSTNSAQDFNRNYSPQSVSNTQFEPTDNVVSLIPTLSKSTDPHVLSSPSNLLKPNFNGLMQRRLEAIKNKKKLTSPILPAPDSTLELIKHSNSSSANISFEDTCTKNLNSYQSNTNFPQRLESVKNKKKSSTILPASDSVLDSTKNSNNSLTNIGFEDTRTKNPNAYQSNDDFSQRYEYKTRSAVQKVFHEQNTFYGHCDRTKNITNTSKSSASSVQNRLIKAKEVIKSKSKFLNQSDVTKSEAVPQPHALNSAHHDLGSSHKYKNKTKRLNFSGSSIKKTKLSALTKEFISNNLDKVTSQHLVQPKKPTTLNSTVPFKSSDVYTNKQGQEMLKSQSKELDQFSYVIPSQTSSVQQRLKKCKKVQCNDDSMEWEDVEPEDIVNKVNDFRKIKHEYEPMEWVPDSIMHSDETNLCIVIDTNILLSNLKPISMVIDTVIPDYGYPTIALPWQVLQELDSIKKSEYLIGFRAREAARWLLNVFSQCHPRVKGQPMTLKFCGNPDDAVLECALNVKERVNLVYLLTDDKMLSIKSEISGITSKNSVWLKNVVFTQNQYLYNTFQDVVAMYPVIKNNFILKCIPRLEHIVSRILRFAVRRKQEVPSYLKKVWWKIYSLKPPLNLTKCLLKLKEHWNIIAPQKMLKPPQKQVEWLVYFLKDLHNTSCEPSFCWHEIYLFLKCCSEVIYYLPYEYYDITDFLLNDIMMARKMLRTKMDCSNFTQDDSLLSNDLSNYLYVSNCDASNIDNILLNILKKVQTFCSNVYAANGIEHKLSKNELNCMDSRSMCSTREVEDFYHKLSNLVKLMLKIQKMKIEQILESQIIVDKLSLAIVALDSGCTELDREKLIDFCVMKDKNVFLSALLSLQNELSAINNLVTTI